MFTFLFGESESILWTGIDRQDDSSKVHCQVQCFGKICYNQRLSNNNPGIFQGTARKGLEEDSLLFDPLRINKLIKGVWTLKQNLWGAQREKRRPRSILSHGQSLRPAVWGLPLTKKRFPACTPRSTSSRSPIVKPAIFISSINKTPLKQCSNYGKKHSRECQWGSRACFKCGRWVIGSANAQY